MRVNVYAEEITGHVEIIEKEANTGATFIGIRFILKTHPDQMRPNHPDDDDAAVTFWVRSGRKGFVPGDADFLARIFDKAARDLMKRSLGGK